MADAVFSPHPLLRNPHIMTMLPAFRPTRASELHSTQQSLIIDVDSESKVMVHYHKVNANAPCLLLVHGLEGSSNAPYLVNLTAKALPLGFNVARMNLRNCGGTMHLTPTLYNAGMSSDVIAVARYLRQNMNVSAITAVGYSLGGNVVLKAAAELSERGDPLFTAAAAVSPAIDLHTAVGAMERGINRVYELRFILGLRAKVRAKSAIYPKRFDAGKLKYVTGMRSFDELFTAPDAGYDSALHYYQGASALGRLPNIKIPTLIIAAQDDPIVPFASFRSPQLQSPYIKLLAPEHGGHGGFIHSDVEVNDLIKSNDRLWAENRILEFCMQNLSGTTEYGAD
ncbi:MAG: YheT family hydrolase [Terriglobales bacterium]